jgi:hypothetical protein
MNRELTSAEFFEELVRCPSGVQAVCVLLSHGNAPDLDANVVRLYETVGRMPYASDYSRIGLQELAVLCSARWDLLASSLATMAKVSPGIVFGVAPIFEKPLESFVVLELGTNEAAKAHPNRQLFVLNGGVVVPFEAQHDAEPSSSDNT